MGKRKKGGGGKSIPLLPHPPELIEIAFSRARKQAKAMKRQRSRLKDAKSRGIKKVEVSGNYIAKRLEKAGEAFPNVEGMHPFYRELVEATLQLDETIKALAQMNSAKRIAVRLKRQHISRLKALGKGQERQAGGVVKEFYGRVAGLAKSLESSTGAYNRAARLMRELPSIQFDMPTAIIAGFPNTGKSTLLSRLTASKPRVAEYPFTTQKLQIGYLIHNEKGWKRLQLIDTPGLLDRPLKKRNNVERKAVAALKHLADAIVFVIDPTERCGFPLEKQARLCEEAGEEFPEARVFLVASKADIAGRGEIERARKRLGKRVFVEGKGKEGGVREELQRLL